MLLMDNLSLCATIQLWHLYTAIIATCVTKLATQLVASLLREKEDSST